MKNSKTWGRKFEKKNTQIIVYEDGKYIELIYNTFSGDKVDRVYRLNKDEAYEEIKEVGKELDYKRLIIQKM